MRANAIIPSKSNNALTRRSAIAGLAIGVLVPAASAMPTDPIYAAIDSHRAAHLRESELCAIAGDMTKMDSGKPAADAATSAASDAADDAAVALTNIRPTTLAGIVALLAYIDDFNCGRVGDSEHYQWPDELLDDDVKTRRGRALEMPYAFWIMRNVQAALATIAVQS